MGRSVPVSSSPVKSIQTGYISTQSLSTGSGEDSKYIDVTISAVNLSKSFVSFEGGSGPTAATATTYNSTTSGRCTARLANSTTVRVSSPSGFAGIAGRWTVVEYN